MAVYSSGSQLEWREAEQLPSPRSGLQATLVDGVLYTTGGRDNGRNYITTVLSWDPVAESWQEAGELVVERHWHAAVAVPASLVGS